MKNKNIAILSLLSKKLFLYLIILVISLSIVTITLTSIGSNYLFKQIEKDAFNRYGSYQMIANSIDDKTNDLLRSKFENYNIGTISYINNIQTKNNNVTIGCLDSNAYNLANIELKSGRMPQNQNEVLVEQFLSEDITIDILINSQWTNFEVVGVIENYSYNQHYNNSVSYPYPSIILHDEYLLNFNNEDIKQSLLIANKQNNIYFNNKLYMIFNELHLKGIDISINDNLNNYINQNLYPIKSVYFLFIIILFISASIISFILITTYYKKYNQKISILMSLGANKKYVLEYLGIQLSIFLFISLITSIILGGIIGYFIFNIVLNINIIEIITIDTIYIVLIWITCFMIELILLCCYITIKINKKSIFQNLKVIDIIQEKIISKDIRKSKLPSIGITISFIVFYLLTFAVLVLARESSGQLEAYLPDYYMNSRSVETYYVADGFNIIKGDYSQYDFNSIQQIYNNPNIKNVTNILDTRGTAILHKKNDPIALYNNELSQDTNTLNEKHLKEIKQIEYIPLNNVQFHAIDDLQYNLLEKNYSIMSDTSKEPFGLLFLPYDIENNNITQINELTIGKINLINDKISLDSYKINIQSVIIDLYQKYDSNANPDYIHIVFPRSVIENINIFPGYSQIMVYLQDSTLNHTSLENELINIHANQTGGIFQSKRDINHDLQKIGQYIYILGIILSYIISLFIFICICISIYLIIQTRRHEYGIKLAMGMQKSQIIKQYFIEILKCQTIAFIICFILFVWYLYFADFDIPAYVLRSFIIFVISIIVGTFTIIIPYNVLRKSSIAFMLKNNE